MILIEGGLPCAPGRNPRAAAGKAGACYLDAFNFLLLHISFTFEEHVHL